MTPTVLTVITKMIAQDVAAGVEMARSLGHKMPTSFDVGVKVVSCVQRPKHEEITLQIRLDDATLNSYFRFLTEMTPKGMREEIAAVAIARIRADALTMLHAWLDKHPEAFLDKSQAEAALKKLAAVMRDEQLCDEWSCEAAAAASKFTYTPVRR
jgi:hypothetical protein